MQEIAKALDGDLCPAHKDDASILLLDREPIRWEGSKQRGLGWIEGDLWRGDASDWGAAARRGACGLVIEGRHRFVHSGVNGLAPVYWIDDGRATYFASRIDPLVQAATKALSVDWDAWAAIIALRHPLGERTPFAEIRRLGPSCTLRRRIGRGRTHSQDWPWAEIEPGTDIEAAADSIVAGLLETLAPLEGEIVSPLSGGKDSRLLLCALARLGGASIAVTVGDDEGETFEEDLAGPVAAALSIPHERLGGNSDAYPEDWEERARRVEYQFVDHAWLVPLARRLEGVQTPVPDGWAMDMLLQSDTHFYSPETLERLPGRRAGWVMFDSLRRYGKAQLALAETFHEPIVARARDQFLAISKPFEGHPSQAVLAFYATRTVRGISTYPTGLLGEGAQILTPAACDRVATPALSVTSAAKRNNSLFHAAFERLGPQVGALPSTATEARSAPRLPRRWRSDQAVEMHRRLIAEGPLSPMISPELTAWLRAPRRGELSGDLRLGMEAVSLFHAWWRRYRNRLQEVDSRDIHR
ncbi:MAG: hypothetical protein WB507_13185 [Solirubrobacterales bacterium]